MADDATDLTDLFPLHLELSKALAESKVASSEESDGASTPSQRPESPSPVSRSRDASRSFMRRRRSSHGIEKPCRSSNAPHQSWAKVHLSFSSRWRDEIVQILGSSGINLRDEGRSFRVEDCKGRQFNMNLQHHQERSHFPMAIFMKKLGKPAWQELRGPLASRCGRWTRVPIDAKDGLGPDRMPVMRSKREACWPMIEVESATAPLAKNVEQRGYLVDELQDFLQRSSTCACDVLRGIKPTGPERRMSEVDIEAVRLTTGITSFHDTEGRHLQVQVGLRCMKPRCAHCSGECNCAWKDPLLDLLELGAEINGRDWKGVTSLLLASGLGHVRMVKFLLEHKADPMLGADPSGWTPLHEAASRGRPGVVDALLEASSPKHRALLEARVGRHKQYLKATAALVAAAKGNVDSLQVLIDYRANLDARQEDGNTALMLAAAGGHSEACELLVKSGCLVCGGPCAAQRRKEIDAGRPLQGCRGACRDPLHVPLRNKKGESAAMIVRHQMRYHFSFLETHMFLESKGIR